MDKSPIRGARENKTPNTQNPQKQMDKSPMRGRKPSRSPQREKLDVEYVEESFLNNHRLVFNGGNK